jgi:ribulose-phosphate 3-epimerase
VILVKIAPSIAAADQGHLSAAAANLDLWGADLIHVDIMDGLFAPNLTFGPATVKAIRKASKLTLDCHLMISNPELLVDRFLDAGGDIMTIHAETVNPESLARIARKVKEHSAKLGVAFKPATDIHSLDLSGVDLSLVTVMTVNPGFSGQKFMPEVLPKLDRARGMFRGRTEIEVDGGVDASNARDLAARGAGILVAGNSVFGQSNPELALKELQKLVAG